MIGSRKKEPPKRVRAQAKPQDSFVKDGTGKSAEQLQQEANLENAGVIIGHAMATVKLTGVDKSLIEILKTVRYWPSRINASGSRAFDPEFNATEISARESTQEDDTNIRVTFSYSDETYDFVSMIKSSSSSDYTFGTITLHENGVRVIDFEIVQDHGNDNFSFRELKAFKYSTWIEKMVRIEKEIESHRKKDV